MGTLFHMKYLTMLMFLTTLVNGMEAVNIPDIERNPLVDFVSFLTSIKTNIINFLTAGFTTQNNDSPQHATLPSSSSHPLHYPPHIPSDVHHHFSPSPSQAS